MDGMVHNDKDTHMDGGTRNTDNVRNDDDGVHSGDIHKGDSVTVDSNHDKEMELESFSHLLFFSHFTL